ncbi:MAG: sensor histidine kinase, partial [Thermoplasmata archaeon]
WEMVLNSLKAEELKGAELEVCFERGEYTIMCDFSILNIFENLFSNAIKHNDKERVKVKVSAKVVEEGLLRICVEDNGPGLPADMRERVFNRFDRGVKEGKISGYGLGLSIVKLATERLGGRVWVEEGEELGGTCFVIELPLKG